MAEQDRSETKEQEPKQVVFEVLVHLKEKTKADFLGDLIDDLGERDQYVSGVKRVDTQGVSLNLKGGRSLNIMGKFVEEKGMGLVGVKWRDDVEPQKTGGVDNGVAVLLQFGYGKSDLVDNGSKDKWKQLSEKVFKDYLWSVDYHENGNKIGLFGPTKVVRRVDGTSAAEEAGKQFVLGKVNSSLGDDGVDFDWDGKRITMPY